uniref:Secreted protein n=1 Tax=Phaeocystis antarctica TaxID=33657 RepID=A0A6T7NMI5_9EUKA|mmetsp:Transcript_14718/g.34726  ORF Transcript_14718/g.34726 Transcript_14718/m.34726 type:complete len:129 (+) Transcript_14718:713-1099(+)
MQLCGLVLVLRGHGLLIVMSKTQPSSIIVPGFICESVVACWHNQHRELPAPADVACSASRFGQLVLHVENGLLEIFLAVCGSSTPASSCQDERRQHDELCRCCCCAAAWPSRARAAPAPQLACTRTPA